MSRYLLVLALLAGCSSDGYVTVHIGSSPTSETQAIAATDNPDVTLAEVGDQPMNILASASGGRHLFATVVAVEVKTKPAKRKHGKHKDQDGACHDGIEAGDMHEGPDAADAAVADDDQDDDVSDEAKPRHKHWTQIFEGAQRVDLFELGVAAGFLAEGSVPAGRLQEIRLVLADDVTFVNNGVTSPVRCPSCSTSGFKIKVHGLRVIGDQAIELSVDLSHSLYQDADGYFLHPVIHLTKVTCDD